ncbi:hypothetical protein J6590_053863 [Homalodisca vitripennis]|nr:hypothetical protein J6590_053863 [Homalodisca vitripennis]
MFAALGGRGGLFEARVVIFSKKYSSNAGSTTRNMIIIRMAHSKSAGNMFAALGAAPRPRRGGLFEARVVVFSKKYSSNAGSTTRNVIIIRTAHSKSAGNMFAALGAAPRSV